MTQEEKQLLLKDLCARLPYSTFIRTYYDNGKLKRKKLMLDANAYAWFKNGVNTKPYLRLMRSMTEEEKEELFNIWKLGKENGSDSVTKLLKEIFYKAINENYILKLATSFENWIAVMEWLNKHHFDYRGLIEKGLAIVAPEGMYEIVSNNSRNIN